MLVRRCADGAELRGRIVETEAYLGGEDRASHSAGGKRTERNTAMFMKPGTIYVYPIYGIYLCMNVSSEGIEKQRHFTDGCKYQNVVLFLDVKPIQQFVFYRQCVKGKRKEPEWSLAD